MFENILKNFDLEVEFSTNISDEFAKHTKIMEQSYLEIEGKEKKTLQMLLF